ncbi:S41 family peptidase [Amycolatopsis sp. PS_44_ISF1]|uniref:S41 family peptidase n=1 Tax=Amycolatopsis sp. PS_44_ISF1 TaxID=2974917 RepID=UPI0028E08A07|nr:S41 family peptidase [Amycolatopsis sp. PS_44_ISF1]MDT8914668.1 S41 family peptidase [Amycolatopsis sp. PS_44_ISF1]
MTENDAAHLIGRVQELVSARYILQDRAPSIVSHLSAGEAELTGLDPETTATVLTRRLHRASNDRHLRIRYRPDGAAPNFAGAEHEARHAAEAPRKAGGLRRVELLADGIGLLQIAPSLSPVHLAEPYVRAAFTLLSSATALVLDLREGRGGTPETVALICGHLLGNVPVHLQDVEELSGPPRQFWTTPAATRINGPIRVLTSHATFSGCEELAYNLQALGRATTVGETTGGGAHPVEAFRLTDVLELHLPVARSVNAITGTNWEQLGVQPDLPCPADQARETALRDLRSTVPSPSGDTPHPEQGTG